MSHLTLSTWKVRDLDNNGFRVFIPSDDDMKPERHKEALRLMSRIDRLEAEVAVLRCDIYGIDKRKIGLEAKIKGLDEVIAELKGHLAGWGY